MGLRLRNRTSRAPRPSGRERRPERADRRARRADSACPRARSHPRPRTPLRWYRARCCENPAPDPSGSPPGDRAAAPSHPGARAERIHRNSRRVLTRAKPIQRNQHAGGRAPDIVGAERYVAHFDLSRAVGEATQPGLMIGRVEYKGERYLKRVLHFLGCQLQLKTRTHEPHDRSHAKAAQQHMIRQIADDGDEARIKTDFLASFELSARK